VTRRVWRVGELLTEVDRLLRQGFSQVWVEGEISGSTTSGRGHVYFTLKDDDAALDCVMWASRAQRLKFRLEDGLAVLALGGLTIYRQRGRFQMVVEDLQPQGLGALQLAFEQLKARLAAEGLFEEARKRPLPPLPQRVGIVTSPGGAALRDMLKILRRFPWFRVVVAPARVQGEGAADEIAGALARLGGSGLVDVIIVGRGGGSLEDLWAFNEELLARAVFRCRIPVVSAVGHEVDFTIADFVADLRAPTPSAAAELLVPDAAALERQLRQLRQRLAAVPQRRLQTLEQRIDHLLTRLQSQRPQARLARDRERLGNLRRRLGTAMQDRSQRRERRLEQLAARLLARHPQHRLALLSRRLAELDPRLRRAIARTLERQHLTLGQVGRALHAVSPLATLERGYAIVFDAQGKVVRSATGVDDGDALRIRLADGELAARAEKR